MGFGTQAFTKDRLFAAGKPSNNAQTVQRFALHDRGWPVNCCGIQVLRSPSSAD
jgi:hypothetical protein